METKKCQQCGQIFSRQRKPGRGGTDSPSRWKTRRFCSHECSNAFRKSRVGASQTCRHCGKMFYAKRLPCGLKESPLVMSKRRYCSTVCYHAVAGPSQHDPSAKSAVQYALKMGRMSRPEACEECGCTPPPTSGGRNGLEGHHDDYNKPLEVRWLCRKCHVRWHRGSRAVPKAPEKLRGEQ